MLGVCFIIIAIGFFTTDAQYPVVADPDVVVFCGGVTCSFYFKRAATKAMQGTIGSGGTGASILAGSLGCQKIPHAIGAGACAAAIVVYGVRAAYSINKAANRNGCFVVRVNLLLAPTALAVGAVTFDDVPASNKHCKA